MFLYTGESVRFCQKRTLLCSRTLRLALHFRCKHLRYAISSLCSFRLPPGTPKNNRFCGCFCIRGGGGEPLGYPKRAAGTSLLYGALPGDCHASYASLLTSQLSQATNACLMLSYSFPPKVQKYLLGTPSLLAMTFFYPQRAEGTHRAAGTSLLPKAKTSYHRFFVHSTFVFSPRKNRPKYGRFFVVWIYCFLLKNALLMLVVFTEQCLVDIIAFC